ncbi:tubulin-specific chaperone cofactor E-like protein isoform X1 [Betta splendens]|uniref:Tubulin-specific chaperone cofactor E-like protein isoform X1 n=2 Tax=Betta splendens TaxID=158456 RepID=A0A6P7PEC2_BETSP|nr:tubulin-specific chaperone cofactor E-like protein isoform X1 [Betta splendens]XP_029028295.1 tubulin-specific chaperone cofactor E-like protein isoform X1 [Betta splendens]
MFVKWIENKSDVINRQSVHKQRADCCDTGQTSVSLAEGEAVQRDRAMDSSEDTDGRSFVEVISEKYSPENFPYRRGPGMGVVVVPTTGLQGSPMKDRLNLPSVLVLNSCGINKAGDQAEIVAFCAHVMELDLSHNKLQDWHEISKIVSNIPNLEFLNLSSNPLAGIPLEPRCAEAFSSVRRLVLNNTQVSWDTVLLLTRETPELEELFLCLNEYSSVSASSVACPTLRLLHITDNSLQDWAEVRKFGSMFPGLDTLVMANNNLASIQDSKDILRRLFPNLRSINLHNSGLSQWEDIEKLNFFPKLEEVRLQGIPLLQAYTNAERRSLMIARLPSVSVLNGSVVTDSEREDAERFFIRYYIDYPEEELPYRYHSLVTKYGKLQPLAEIDLRPRFYAQVEVHFEEKVEQLNIRLDQTVAELKKQLTTVVQLSTNSMRLYYIDKGSAFGPEELKYNTRALHSYSIQDGDEILVVPKNK